MRGVIYRNDGILLKTYPTEKGAKIALTRAINDGKKIRGTPAADCLTTDATTFAKTIDRKVTKINLMSGKPFVDSINTPACCDPSTETYWSM